MTRSILLVGSSGNVGKPLLNADRTNRYCLGTSRSERNSENMVILDPADSNQLIKIIEEYSIEVVVLLSAISSVAGCVTNPNSMHINVSCPLQISNICKKKNKKFVFMSTEYLYNGDIFKEKDESVDNLNPQNNLYSLQKYCAENLILGSNPDALVLRLPKMYSFLSESSFASSIATSIKECQPLKLAKDQIFSALASEDLYSILIKATLENTLSGIYNCGGPERNSRYAYGLDISKTLYPDKIVNISAVNMRDFSGSDTIPLDVSMNSRKLFDAIDFVPRSLIQYVRDFKNNGGFI